ncbi:MAG: riboflavin kinase/FMN adenylyltransferase [Patiriisocius sp.]
MHQKSDLNLKIYQGLAEFGEIEKPVLTIGTFDGVHIGHQKIIDRINEIAKDIGGSSVLLTFSPHPRQVLSPFRSMELLTILDEKIALLEAAGLEHLIIHPFTEDFAKMQPKLYIRDILVNAINANYVVVGYDHHYGKNREGDFKLIKDLSSLYDYNVEEISVKTIEDINVSSTKIRHAIKAGDIPTARKYLGHEFTFSGTVVSGDQRGRELGFPTANLLVSPDKIIPDTGVFAVRAQVKGLWYQGMLNVGFKPTVNDSVSKKSIEVNLFNFDKQIYGEKVIIEINSKLRDEIKFNSLDDLKLQLNRDMKLAERRLANS